MKDVLPRYTAMATWKSRKLAKKLRGSRTRSTVGKVYIAVPPADGWKGGLPEQNGWKP